MNQRKGHLRWVKREENSLKHYASPYYDPVKAHEYYMRTRELKGRGSTAGLNEEGKDAAKYVKEQLTTERKEKVGEHKAQTQSAIDRLKDEKTSYVEGHRTQMQSKIDSLKSRLKGMSGDEKRHYSVQMKKTIAALREENKRERERLQQGFSGLTNALRGEHKSESARLKEEYDERYYDELDAIRADPEFRRVYKTKKS